MAPSVLVLGGVGFIGRNFVQYLIDNNLASSVRIVDKALPATAYLTEKQKAAFDKCEYIQRNLVNPSQIETIFKDASGKPFDLVVNLAAETKYSQTDEVYNERVYTLTMNCAKQAAKDGCKRFIEFSTAQVYDADKKASDESSKLKPWTTIAKYKIKAEEDLKGVAGLDYLIVRPAIVYGPGDIQGLTPRLIIGAVYKHLKEEMKFLWTKDLRINTVHVTDVCAAIMFLFEKGVKGEVYNLADKGDTDQETVNTILRSLYKIETGYQGTVISNFAKLNLESVTEDINDKHLQPWSDICKAAGITNSPLTPYLDQELLYNNSLTVNGGKIESLGFAYKVPKLNEEGLREVLQSFIETKAFPPNIL